jgi:hypothetical protein
MAILKKTIIVSWYLKYDLNVNKYLWKFCILNQEENYVITNAIFLTRII